MKNERNAGRPPKFIKAGKMKYMQRKVPVNGYKEISEAFDKMIREQFADRDWT